MPVQEIQILKPIEDVRTQKASEIEIEDAKEENKEDYYERKEKLKREEEFRNRKRRNSETTEATSSSELQVEDQTTLPTVTEKVYYRKRDIEKWLGNKALNEKLTNKCIEEIKKFSLGEKTEIAKLAEYNDIYRIRVQVGRDKMRLILRETDNHVFEVIDLIPQKDDGKNSYAGY